MKPPPSGTTGAIRRRPNWSGAFFLDDEDRKLVKQHRGQHNQLGFSRQLATARDVGTLGMEDHLGALVLALNAVVACNTTYRNAAVGQLRAQSYPVAEEDAAWLSALIDTHLNVHGPYVFQQPHLIGPRPLHDPARPPG
ncbi:Tn3 family transposase [Actinocrispum wychmicini]|uniref:Uncharacterized protein DUF4158 n=1 Tax=Actinocrispum wychmicini TaxID=1213861 RepID=A0A4R2J8M6_9PSEU|nr:Tn3 family transposase [Actinocrispum wychmicini]TCO55643.1 uncharacterized protein DUF4158 [Actinocrispum wychmicini]